MAVARMYPNSKQQDSLGPGAYVSSVQGSELFTRTWSSEPTWRSLPWMVILVPPALGPTSGSRNWTCGSCVEEGRIRLQPGPPLRCQVRMVGLAGGKGRSLPYHV